MLSGEEGGGDTWAHVGVESVRACRCADLRWWSSPDASLGSCPRTRRSPVSLPPGAWSWRMEWKYFWELCFHINPSNTFTARGSHPFLTYWYATSLKPGLNTETRCHVVFWLMSPAVGSQQMWHACGPLLTRYKGFGIVKNHLSRKSKGQQRHRVDGCGKTTGDNNSEVTVFNACWAAHKRRKDLLLLLWSVLIWIYFSMSWINCAESKYIHGNIMLMKHCSNIEI